MGLPGGVQAAATAASLKARVGDRSIADLGITPLERR